MAATCPSIMSEGATTSAPASASEDAVRASRSSVASLSTVNSSPPPLTTPQCPCELYSHRHTSAIRTRLFAAPLRRSARSPCCVMPPAS
jgi:hypothetical protein